MHAIDEIRSECFVRDLEVSDRKKKESSQFFVKIITSNFPTAEFHRGIMLRLGVMWPGTEVDPDF
jgi:hypothetical protein